MSGVIAIYDYKQALNTNPQFSYAYNNLGDALAAKRDYTQSIINYGNALKINPKYFEAYYGRGLSNYAIENYDLAIKDFSTALKLKDKFALGYAHRAEAWTKKGNIDEAPRRKRTGYQSGLKTNLDYGGHVVSPKPPSAYFTPPQADGVLENYNK